MIHLIGGASNGPMGLIIELLNVSTSLYQPLWRKTEPTKNINVKKKAKFNSKPTFGRGLRCKKNRDLNEWENKESAEFCTISKYVFIWYSRQPVPLLKLGLTRCHVSTYNILPFMHGLVQFLLVTSMIYELNALEQ